MNKSLFLILIIIVISGCEMQQSSAVKPAEVTKVTVEESAPVPEQPPVAIEKEKVVVKSEPVKVEAIVLVKEIEAPISKSAEEIITQNRWGISIYDPKIGTIEYFTSNGGYLGKKSVQR